MWVPGDIQDAVYSLHEIQEAPDLWHYILDFGELQISDGWLMDAQPSSTQQKTDYVSLFGAILMYMYFKITVNIFSDNIETFLQEHSKTSFENERA